MRGLGCSERASWGLSDLQSRGSGLEGFGYQCHKDSECRV